MRISILVWVVVVVALAGISLGYYLRRPETITEYRDRVVTQRITEREKTTTPDGSVVERITERETKDSKQDVPKPSPKSPERDYAIGAQWRDKETPTAVELGYRLMGGVWAEGRYDWKRKEPTIGVRIEW